MNEAAANISWLPFDPRDWEQLTPAFGRLRSMVGAHGPKLIANNHAATFFDRCVHEGLLELALVAPDFTYRLFDAAERQKLTIRVPLNYEEGCGIEPYHEGCWYARRSNLEQLTAIPVTPAAPGPARTSPAELVPTPPIESPRVKPVPLPTPTSAANVGDQTGAAPAAADGYQITRVREHLKRLYPDGIPNKDDVGTSVLRKKLIEDQTFQKELRQKGLRVPSWQTVKRARDSC